MKRILAFIILFVTVLGVFPAPALTELDREANKKIIFDYVTKKMGLTPAVACGILANVKAESNFDPEAIGDGGAAYGICQWNSRRDTMIKFCEENGYGSWKNIEGQLAYMAYELSNYKKSVGDFLKTIPNTAQGAYDAAYHFCYYYEIPANRTTKSKQRGTNAVNTYWRDAYGGKVDTYTITYNANGGTDAPKPQTKTEGIPTLITLSEPVLEGHTLVGWSLKADASTFDYKGYDEFSINSDTTLYAIWERVIDSDTNADATYKLNGHTYELYKGSYTWTYANSFAKEKGGYLATVETQAEYEAVKTLVQKAEGDCWLGGKYSLGNWQWVTGEAFRDDFAASKWAKGEPYAIYGPTERGRLAQREDGKWIDLKASSFAAEGFIVEYGSRTKEAFPTYEITVSTSLRLREGPGTTFETLDHAYNGELITILDIAAGSSYDWGWGYTANGKTGWCAMKIPDYMVSVGGVDEESGLTYIPYNDGCAIMGYRGAEKHLVIPSHIGNLPVIAVFSGAFASPDGPDAVQLPDSVCEIAADSMKTGGHYLADIGSETHVALAETTLSYRLIYPEKTLCPPAALTEIGEGAFGGAGNVECVNLSGSSLKYIGAGAFDGMDALRYVQLPSGSLTIEEGAFDLNAGVIFIVQSGSDAESWAEQSGADHISLR